MKAAFWHAPCDASEGHCGFEPRLPHWPSVGCLYFSVRNPDGLGRPDRMSFSSHESGSRQYELFPSTTGPAGLRKRFVSVRQPNLSPPFEIVIVDDGITDAYCRCCRTLSREAIHSPSRLISPGQPVVQAQPAEGYCDGQSGEFISIPRQRRPALAGKVSARGLLTLQRRH